MILTTEVQTTKPKTKTDKKWYYQKFMIYFVTEELICYWPVKIKQRFLFS